MATRTLGTNANNSLVGFVVGFNDLIPADVATLNLAIRGDPPGYNSWNNVQATGLVQQGATSVNTIGTVRPRVNQAYVRNGVLFVPNRGRLVLKNGDLVAWDSTTGWPIVVSGDAVANGPYHLV
jgi:hypothetical protein